MTSLLYDGDCRLCTMSVKVLGRLVPTTARVESWRSAALPAAGMAPVQPPRSLHWIADDQHARGVAAIAWYLRSSTSKPWRRIGLVLGRPSAVSALEALPDKMARLGRSDRPLPTRPPLRRPPPPPPEPAATGQPSDSAPKVRRRTKGDLQSTVRLLYAARDHGDYRGEMPESPSDWLDGPGIWAAWVIRPGPSVLGHVAVSRLPDDLVTSVRWKEVTGADPGSLGLVTRFLVHPDVVDEGYGDALLAVADREIRRRGLTPVMEVVSPSGEALPVLDSNGWTQLAIYPWGEPDDGLQVHYYVAPDA